MWNRYEQDPTSLRSKSERSLLDAALYLTSQIDLTAALRHFVELAVRFTQARYGALGVVDNRGNTSTFVQAGMSREAETIVGQPPVGKGVLGTIMTDGPTLINDITKHADFYGYPPGHPVMDSFLGVPIKVRNKVYGRLYLTDKPGGFTENDAADMISLGEACAVAVQNAGLFKEANAREKWLNASQEITTMLLKGQDEEEALEAIAEKLKVVSDSDTTLIVLPSVGGQWVAEITAGNLKEELLGTVFPTHSRTVQCLATRTGVVLDSIRTAERISVPNLRLFGPTLFVPMLVDGRGTGVIVLLRQQNRVEFTRTDLSLVEAVADQTALALELAAARHAQDLSSTLEERERISRDLHDLAIQQLFATGMSLETIRAEFAARGEGFSSLVALLDKGLASVDSSVHQIRSIVHSLRESDESAPMLQKLRDEASNLRSLLGFAPSIICGVDGVIVGERFDMEGTFNETCAKYLTDRGEDNVIAVVREGMSNTARHAHASKLTIDFQLHTYGSNPHLNLVISDNGIGFPTGSGRRSGLANLARRAEEQGGSMNVDTSPGQGTKITWSIPLRETPTLA